MLKVVIAVMLLVSGCCTVRGNIVKKPANNFDRTLMKGQ